MAFGMMVEDMLKMGRATMYDYTVVVTNLFRESKHK